MDAYDCGAENRALKRKASWSSTSTSSRDNPDISDDSEPYEASRSMRMSKKTYKLKFRRDSAYCRKCEDMTGTQAGLNALLSKSGYKHLNWYEIQESAEQGCRLCNDIWEVTEHADWDCDTDGSVTRDQMRIYAHVAPQENRFSRDDVRKGTQLHAIEINIPLDTTLAYPDDPEGEIFHLLTKEGDPSSRFIPARLESKVLSPELVHEVRRWLDSCLKEHPACPRPCIPELPRRVIDLGDGDSPARLHEPQKEQRAEFATLSYCWGANTNYFTTTRSNLPQNLISLPTILPKTISDAMEVCQKLRIRYLWIDALCIIQDDEDDKLDQIADMGSIYKRSTLTIVAANAAKVTDGFLSDGKLFEARLKLPIHTRSKRGTVYLRQKQTTKAYSVDEPIFERAWTFQELLLAPRALIFNSHQINVKCFQHGIRPAIETYLDFEFDCRDLPEPVFGMSNWDLDQEPTKEGKLKRLERRQNDLWTSIIEEYTSRLLTKFDDRLPALAGIASELAKVWEDVYIAGFWEKILTQQLGWHRSDTASIVPGIQKRFEYFNQDKRLGSPSWSWVTMCFPITVFRIKEPAARLVSHNVQLVSEASAFGSVKRATIVLQAKLLNLADAGFTFANPDEYSYTTGETVLLDFKNPGLKLTNCKLVYLGRGDQDRKAGFLLVEQCGAETFHRVGFAKTERMRADLSNILSSTKESNIILE